MTVRTTAELKLLFEKGDKPTAQDFVDLIDSFLHAQGGNFPDPLPAVSGAALENIGDALPNPLPARDGSQLTGITPSEYNVLPGNPTPSYASAVSFVLTGDFTSSLFVDRRLELTIAGAPFYTSVDAVVFAAGVTTVTTRNSMPGSALTALKMSIIRPAANGGAADLQTLGGTTLGEALMAAIDAAAARAVINAASLDTDNAFSALNAFTRSRSYIQGADDSTDSFDGIEADNRPLRSLWRRKVAGVPLNRFTLGLDGRNSLSGGDSLALDVYDDAGNFDSTVFQFRRNQPMAIFFIATGSNSANVGNISGVWAPNLSASNYLVSSIFGNITDITPSNGVSGFIYYAQLKQDGVGNRTIVWPASFKFPGGVKPALSTAPNAIDLLEFAFNGTDYLCTLNKGFA